MNKERLGAKLSHIRNGKSITRLSKYVVKSIEDGRASYSISKLIVYCEELSLQMAITDLAFDEVYPVDTIFEVHDVLQMLMRRWNIDESMIYRKTGAHYTAPKYSASPLSINTMLSMCKVLHCKLDFVTK